MRGRRNAPSRRKTGIDDVYYRDLAGCEPMSVERERLLARELVALTSELEQATKAERRALELRIRKIRDRFVVSNLRLVVKLATQYQQGTIPLGDLIQEGNLALLTAIERFDPAREIRFCTYAAWWIRHRMSRAKGNHGRAARVPTHLSQMASKLSRLRRDFEATRERRPTLEELAALAGIAPQRASVALLATGPALSLDTPVDEEDRRTLGDLIETEEALADDRLASERRRADIERALAALPPLEAEILRRRFTFDGDVAPTLRELGREHSLSRERIRQLQNRALGRLRERLAHREGEAA